MNIQTLHRWHQTKSGLLAFVLTELLIAYLLASRAIDTGSLIEYFLTFIFLAGSLVNFGKLIKKLFHGEKH